MAARIERQLADQKELLAGVSHEIRTPLARLRVLTELLRESGTDERRLRQVEAEIAEIDDLTGRLLASARLDFDARDVHSLDILALAREALTRAGLVGELLEVKGGPAPVRGDATLLARALANLLHNAQEHGAGARRLLVEFESKQVRVTIEDGGSGFAPDDLKRAFESFFRGQGEGQGRGSLGLGLALVKRIARAHGGDTFANNLPLGGASVGFFVPIDAN
jgi:signal transduction histidine kinase